MAPMDLNPKDIVPIEKRTTHLVCKRCGSKVDPATGKCTDKACGLIQRPETRLTGKVTSGKPTGVPPAKQPGAKYQKPADVPSTAPQYVCPNCGTGVSAAQGHCPNQKGCGYSGFMKQRDIQQTTISIEPTVTSPAPAPVNYPPTAKTFLTEMDKTPETTEHYTPKTRSPMLMDIEQEEAKGRGFPKREKREKQLKPKKYSEPREWHFPSVGRFIRPALASLLLLIVAASLVFVVIRFVIPAASQFVSKPTLPTPVAPTPTLRESYTLSVGVSPQEAGSVSRFPEKESYAPDTQITLTAIAANGYTFDHWEGGSISDVSSTVTIGMDSAKNITAYFIDRTEPVISDTGTDSITDLTANIMWTTSEKTTGQVEYGKTDDYGKTVESLSGQSAGHIARLSGLLPNTTYYFRIKCRDASGNDASPYSSTFTTARAIPSGYETGRRALDFALPSYRDNDEPDSPNNPTSPYWTEKLALSDFRGKNVIVNFWSTYCGACLLEFPVIRDVYQKPEFADKNKAPELALITVCIDGRDDRIVKLKAKFGDQVGPFTFPILLDKEGISKQSYKIQTVPTTMFIDKDGIIRHIRVGAFETTNEVTSILKSL